MTWLVAACCIREDHVLTPLFGNPVVRYVGKISYGMYLLHMLVLNVVRRATPASFQLSPLFFPLSLVLIIAVAGVDLPDIRTALPEAQELVPGRAANPRSRGRARGSDDCSRS